jgi:hypothetical protein
MRVRRFWLASLLCVTLLCPARAGSQTSELIAVLTRVRQQMKDVDFRASGRLVRVTVGQRQNYRFTLKAHWFPDGLSLLFETTDPTESRVRLLVTVHPEGRTLIQVAHPGDKRASFLPQEKWGDGLLSTDFSYEDLTEGQFFWQRQSLLASVKYGARDCYVLKSEPGEADRTHYGAVTSWLDRKILYPVHVEKTVKGSDMVKDYDYLGLRQTSGVWSANQVEARTHGKSDSSLLIIERGSAKAGLTRKDFDPGLLTRP